MFPTSSELLQAFAVVGRRRIRIKKQDGGATLGQTDRSMEDIVAKITKDVLKHKNKNKAIQNINGKAKMTRKIYKNRMSTNL